MIVTFEKDYLRDLYETGKADKKHRFQPDIVKRYIDRINTLKKQGVHRSVIQYEILALRSVEGREGGYIIHKGK